MLVTWIGVLISGFIFANLGGSLLPDFDEGSIQVNATLPSGSSLEASNMIAGLVDKPNEKFAVGSKVMFQESRSR